MLFLRFKSKILILIYIFFFFCCPLNKEYILCIESLKVGFVVAGGGFYYYHIHPGNKSDKERKTVRKNKFYAYKKI